MDLGLTAVDASGRAEGGWQDKTADDGTTAGALGAMLRNWRPFIWEWVRASLCMCDFRGLERCSWVFMSATVSLKIPKNLQCPCPKTANNPLLSLLLLPQSSAHLDQFSVVKLRQKPSG